MSFEVPIMMSPPLPYQCMVYGVRGIHSLLLATRGSRIDIFEDSALLSTWACPSMQEIGRSQTRTEVSMRLTTQNSESSSVEITIDSSSHPAKKRKVSASESTETRTDSKEGKKRQNNRSDAVLSGLEAPAIVAMVITKDCRHVIVITGEDKSIRVLEIAQEDGVFRLKQLSQRAMPKRPCALTITDDDSTIISADKFGDVYALALIELETSETLKSGTCKPEPAAKTFTPAANELTIHSQRNLKALENQRRQTNKTAEKPEPSFEHTLLLGHVSMLTDIALIQLRGRSYIITADRDEHIRISRGIPHTYIIERFCLGHSDFVSRLCVPVDRPHLLVSGGGDDEIFVWEWESGSLVSKTNLKIYVSAMMETITDSEEMVRNLDLVKIAVSGIYCTKQTLNNRSKDIIVITCEGIPALFTFVLTEENHLEYIQTFELPGNALAVVVDINTRNKQQDSSNHLLVSIDTMHRPGSTMDERDDTDTRPKPFQRCKFGDGKLVLDESMELPVAVRDYGDASSSGASGRLTNLLYSLENLRKREGEGQEE